MIVTLAGYNVESDLLKNPGAAAPEALTPETLSAAYARISRSAKDIAALRLEARKDVEKTRKSNQTIVFKYGHHSVAEHAVFNFDIIDVSRLALEEIEQFRLLSYTEKSQRYVKLKGDYVLPEEIKDPGAQQLFRDTVRLQNEFYTKAFTVLKEYLYKKYAHMTEKRSDRGILEGWAKEDARYILSLATEGQVGLTINARSLEHLFRRFHLSRRAEVREIGKRMHEQVLKVAPSLILFAQPSRFARDLKHSFKDNFTGLGKDSSGLTCSDAPRILGYTENADDIILASFLSIFYSMPFKQALDAIENMDATEKERVFKDLFKHMEFFDPTPREFEMVDITFEAVVCASNFAQLKRHRMATLLPGEYNIELGNVIPENIKINGLEKEFLQIIHRTNQVYLQLKEEYGEAADYILTNSHCRQVLMRMNLREVYHFIRLRADSNAQWDIRQLARHLLQQIKPFMPFAAMLLCGKSDFIKEYENIYHQKPELLI